MANPSKRTGTEGENHVLQLLHDIGYTKAERTSPGSPSRDITGVPFVVEVKRTKTLQVPAWTRKLEDDHEGHDWFLFARPRDGRRADAHPPLVIMHEATAAALLEAARKGEPMEWV